MKYSVEITFESFRDGLFMQSITVNRVKEADYLQEALEESIKDFYANITEVGMDDSRIIGARIEEIK